MDGVVPLAVEVMGFEVYLCKFLVRYTPALGIDPVIDAALHQQTGLGGRGADQVDDDLMSEQRFAAPVLGDERE